MDTEIIFVRHGETQGNVLGLLHGWTDVPLTELGIQQAHSVAKRVAEFQNIHHLYSSPLMRARATAEAIARRIDLTPRFHDHLVELNFGDLEGYTFNRLEDEYPDLLIQFLANDLDAGFPNGETPRAFHERVRQVIEELIEAHRGERIVVVAHSGVISSGIAQLTDGDPNYWVKYQVRNCSVTHLQLSKSGDMVLYCNDDVAHLGMDTEEVF